MKNIQESWKKILKKKKFDMAMNLNRTTYDLLVNIEITDSFLNQVIFPVGEGGKFIYPDYGVNTLVYDIPMTLHLYKYKDLYLNMTLDEETYEPIGKTLEQAFPITKDGSDYIHLLFEQMNLLRLIASNETKKGRLKKIKTMRKWDKEILKRCFIKKYETAEFMLKN